jgi:cation:H+ antiporter
MILSYVLLFVSLLILVVSGQYLIKGSVTIASRFKMSSLVVGMTVVAFGTSAPELIVSVNAAIAGHPDIAIGNVVGSNIANVALVLGLTAAIIALPIVSRRLFWDWLVMMGAYLMLWLMMQNGLIEMYEGLIMIVILAIYTWYSVRVSIKNYKGDESVEKPLSNSWLAVIVVVASCAGLAFGADMLVGAASEIASGLGVSERVISVTIVAFGTSVPELTASLVAAFKKETEISVGNIVGSNLFNILIVLGVASIITPIHVDYEAFRVDLIWMVMLGIMLLVMIYPFRANISAFRTNKDLTVLVDLRQGLLSRSGGWLLAVIYVLYVFLLFYI